MPDIKPQGNCLLLELVDLNAASKIYIPEDVGKDSHQVFRVLALGEGKMIEDGVIVPIKVSVGDEVVVAGPGAVIKMMPESLYGGRKLFLSNSDVVLAVIGRKSEMHG